MLLELKEISKRFPGVQALDRVSLTLAPGEIHGLVGENGAGKSTLIKILTGIYTPDGGQMLWRGQAVKLSGPRDARRLGISVIHQHRTLVPFFSGYENLFLGKAYPRRRLGLVSWSSMKREARRLQEVLGLQVDLDVPVVRLSPAQQTVVEILRAFQDQADLIILDEPTATLTDQEAESLFAAIERLRQQGTAFLYVSHRLEEIFQLTQRVTVLRNGRCVGTWPTAGLTRDRLIEAMAGEEATQSVQRPPAAAGAIVLRARGLSSRCGRVRDVSLDVRAGEVLGLFGLVGAGRSELLQVLYGVRPLARGHLELDGRPLQLASARDGLRNGIRLIPEDRHRQGLVLGMNVRENMTLALLDRFRVAGGTHAHWLGIISQARERRYVGEMVHRLQIRTPSLEQRVDRLSGGNQQKVVFGRALLGDVRVLLCDEPTLGVDVGARREIYQLLFQMAAEGCAVVFASSDLQEVLAVSHRIGVMRDGRLAAVIPAEEASARRILEICYGKGTA